MRSRVLWLSGLLLALLWGSGAPARAQLPQAGGPQIPTLQVCNATVYKLCDRGELAHVRILNSIRIAPADLVDLMRRRRKAPPFDIAAVST